jgi:hypothetical protein
MLLLFARPLLGALVGFVIASASHAQVAALPQIELTPETVGKFVASYPAVKAKGEELQTQYGLPADLSGTDAWRAWAGVGGAKSQLDGVVGRYGFSDFSNWLGTLSATARAFAFAQSGSDLDSKMAEALTRIENDPDIPEGQKELMRQQLKHSAAAIAAMKPPQQNIDAVKPYADQLGRLFDAKGDSQ